MASTPQPKLAFGGHNRLNQPTLQQLRDRLRPLPPRLRHQALHRQGHGRSINTARNDGALGQGACGENLGHQSDGSTTALAQGGAKWDAGQGAGLGLVLSHHLIQLMGGTLNYSTKAGDGSVFFFNLPISSESQKPL